MLHRRATLPQSSGTSKGKSVLKFRVIYGVDFSGARLAGRNTWVARIERGRKDEGCRESVESGGVGAVGRPVRDGGAGGGFGASGRVDREVGGRALWTLDFPFGMPVEVLGERWSRQFEFLGEWGEDGYGAGLECVRRSKELCGAEAHPPPDRHRGARAVRPVPLPHHLPDVPRHARRARAAPPPPRHGHPAVPVPAARRRAPRARRGVPGLDAQAHEAPAPELQAAGGRPADARRRRTRRRDTRRPRRARLHPARPTASASCATAAATRSTRSSRPSAPRAPGARPTTLPSHDTGATRARAVSTSEVGCRIRWGKTPAGRV